MKSFFFYHASKRNGVEKESVEDFLEIYLETKNPFEIKFMLIKLGTLFALFFFGGEDSKSLKLHSLS